VVGDKEIAASTVSIRLRNREQLTSQSFDSFKKTVRTAIASKVKDLRL